MRAKRWLTMTVFATAILIVLPQLAEATSSTGSATHSAAFLTGCTSQTTVAAEPAPEITQVASVFRHTERERQLRQHRVRATERQEARASGMQMDRVLEIALHPMFLLILAVPLIRRMRAL